MMISSTHLLCVALLFSNVLKARSYHFGKLRGWSNKVRSLYQKILYASIDLSGDPNPFNAQAILIH